MGSLGWHCQRFKEEIRDIAEGQLKAEEASAGHVSLQTGSKQERANSSTNGLPRKLQLCIASWWNSSNASEPFSVRYHELGTLLLNEAQRQDRLLDEQQKQIQAQAAQIADPQAQLAALRAHTPHKIVELLSRSDVILLEAPRTLPRTSLCFRGV